MKRRSRHIALVTERRYETPVPSSPFIQNILDEDALLSGALERHDVSVQRVDWSRGDVDWTSFDAAVIRTTWDYFERIDEFRRWLGEVAAQSHLINPLRLCRWNFDKHYLLELEEAGVATVPTVPIAAGEPLALARRLSDAGWPQGVVKPAISGAAYRTFRVDANRADEVEGKLAEASRSQAFLLQPFMPSIQEHGEVTVVVIDGETTHAIRKTAAPGDFRVQDDHGGSVHPHQASPDEIALAQQAIAACPSNPLYGRVDMVAGADGRPRLVELELIEPELWLRFHPPAAVRMAEAVAAELRRVEP